MVDSNDRVFAECKLQSLSRLAVPSTWPALASSAGVAQETFPTKTPLTLVVSLLLAALLLPLTASAQVNSGSNGSDGAFNPTTNIVIINMADHPDGIYQYTSVNISNFVNVSFIPNANNTPVKQHPCHLVGARLMHN